MQMLTKLLLCFVIFILLRVSLFIGCHLPCPNFVPEAVPFDSVVTFRIIWKTKTSVEAIHLSLSTEKHVFIIHVNCAKPREMKIYYFRI